MDPLKIALVSGGTQGLGRAISLALLNEGYCVHALYQKNRTAAAALEDLAKAQKLPLETHQVDLENLSEIDNYFAKHLAGKPLAVLVHNASSHFELNPLLQWSNKDIQNLLAVNVSAAFRLSQLALPLLKSNKWGRIISILSSTTLGTAATGMSGYTVAKYGLLGLTLSIAAEFQKFHITANAISPGAIDCGIFKRWPEHLQHMMVQKMPEQRALSVDQVTEKILFLLSAAGDEINGENIAV